MKDIVDLAVATITKENIPSEFTAADLENSLREQLSAFQDYKYLRKHAADLYEIIEEVANVIIPKKVLEQFGGFAEIRRKGYGEKISFTFKRCNGVYSLYASLCRYTNNSWRPRNL